MSEFIPYAVFSLLILLVTDLFLKNTKFTIKIKTKPLTDRGAAKLLLSLLVIILSLVIYLSVKFMQNV